MKFFRVRFLWICFISVIPFTASFSNSDDYDYGGWGKPFPSEIKSCELREGKTMLDLFSIVDTWNEMADESGINHYTAYILRPIFSTNQDLARNIIWYGNWSLESKEPTIDILTDSERGLPQLINSVVACNSSIHYWGWRVFDGVDLSNNKKRMITISECEMESDWDNLRGKLTSKSDDDLLRANKALFEFFKDKSPFEQNASQLWANSGFLGSDIDSTPDFLWLREYESVKAYEDQNRESTEQGFWAFWLKTFRPVVDCHTSRAFNALRIRKASYD